MIDLNKFHDKAVLSVMTKVIAQGYSNDRTVIVYAIQDSQDTLIAFPI